MTNDKPVLLATAYLPPAAYFALLLAKPVIIERHETYPKQTYRNRCLIYSEKGVMALSIPVHKPRGNHTKTGEVEIANYDKWYLRHWRAIEAAYSASPYFLYYRDELKPFFEGKHRQLFRYNYELIEKLCQLTDIQPEITFTDHFEKNPEEVTDLRYIMSPKNKPVAKHFPEYIQVFSDRHGFLPDLSVIDILFNLGPETKRYLKSIVFD